MAKHIFGICLLGIALALGGSSATAESDVLSLETPAEAAPAFCSTLPVAQAHFAAAVRAGWHCNCNTNQDCDAVCGEKNHTCLIFAVCDNWPDFTGRCSCDKTVTVQPTAPKGAAGF